MKIYILIILFITPLSFVFSQNFEPKNGDLIFQESCSGGVGDAIKGVTTSIDENKFTHVGIVYVDPKDSSIYVLEATTPKVSLTPLREYLYPESEECFPKSVVGRLKPEYLHLIPEALNYGITLIGKEYDYGYVLNNDKYYCSELVYEILKYANAGDEVFPLNVMTFESANTGEIMTGWAEYFDSRDLPVPEGEPGINPGAMSRSDVIDIIHYY